MALQRRCAALAVVTADLPSPSVRAARRQQATSLTMGNRRETIMRLAKGFFGRRKNCFALAIRAVEKGLQKAYVGRKLKKRVVRREWIVQIGAGAREHNISYAKLIFGMRFAEIGVNRKILATLAQQEPYSFRAIVEEAKLGLKKAVETDPRYAKTPRTKKYPPWLISLSKEKADLAADQWKLERPRQKTSPPPSKNEVSNNGHPTAHPRPRPAPAFCCHPRPESLPCPHPHSELNSRQVFATAVAERAKEKAAAEAAAAAAAAAEGGEAAVLADGLLFRSW